MSSRLLAVRLGAAVLLAGILTAGMLCAAQGRVAPAAPTATPEPTAIPHIDRLALPTLPTDPTAAQVGQYLYYYDCMPCHGDRGQGLTDEWRQVWVEDHQNCWARGCHGGRPMDEGFPLPRIVPPVIEGSGGLVRFPSADVLEGYLAQTHPPQRPGSLDASEVEALAAFLLEANGRPVDDHQAFDLAIEATLASAALLALVLFSAWVAIRSRRV